MINHKDYRNEDGSWIQAGKGKYKQALKMHGKAKGREYYENKIKYSDNPKEVSYCKRMLKTL